MKTPMPGCRGCGSARTKLLYPLRFASVVRCENCDLLFLDPAPDEEALSNFYNDKNYFLGQTDYFGDSFKNYSPDSLMVKDYTKVLKRLPFKAGGRLLDVGCATGVFLDLARKEGWSVQGVEMSRWAGDYARSQFQLDVFTGTIEQAAFPRGSFDVITAWDVFEHMKDPVSFLKEAGSVLKPDGVLYINTICHRSLLNFIAHGLYVLSFRRISFPIYRLFGLHHLFYFSKKSLKNMLQANGFVLRRLELEEYRIERINQMDPLIKTAVWAIYKIQKITGMNTTVAATACPTRLREMHLNQGGERSYEDGE